MNLIRDRQELEHTLILMHQEGRSIRELCRQVTAGDGVYVLREPEIPYTPDFTHENGDLRPENTYPWGMSA